MKEREVILTTEGLRRLEGELEILKSVRRREVAERIKQAIEFGDITENSEFEDAKNEQAFVEGRILTLEKMLRHARIIDAADIETGVVSVGSAVLVKDLIDGTEHRYTIVGSAEADPGAMKISNESPVGKALLGQPKGAVVDVEIPDGRISLMILDITKP
ncbi:MAG TPA: transcription elongation factor GreA [Desulfotomaculum sp.]|nr:transcription elongation factor GreA [Desulfotomaculum sp.]